MKSHPSKRSVTVFLGVSLFLLVSCLTAPAQNRVKHSHALRQPIPRHTTAFLSGPINAQPFWCDWERKAQNTHGMAAATVMFTRTLPQNGWVAKVHYEYETGNKLDQEFQMFNSRPAYNEPKTPATPKRQIGTTWDFQLTNGTVSCQLFVSISSGEMRFSKCTNGVEQYCLTRRLPDILTDKKFPECKSGTIIDRARCLERGLVKGGPMTAIDNDPVCEDHPVACLTYVTFKDISPELLHMFLTTSSDLFVQAVLTGLRQDWIDTVNRSLGPCESSHLCPAFTFCSQGSCQQLFKY